MHSPYVQRGRPTWKNYSYDRLQQPNISDGQCTACNSGYIRRKFFFSVYVIFKDACIHIACIFPALILPCINRKMKIDFDEPCKKNCLKHSCKTDHSVSCPPEH